MNKEEFEMHLNSLRIYDEDYKQIFSKYIRNNLKDLPKNFNWKIQEMYKLVNTDKMFQNLLEESSYFSKYYLLTNLNEKTKSFNFYNYSDEESIKEILFNEGPLYIEVKGNLLDKYMSGIFNPYSCEIFTEYNYHGVILLGWGSDEGTDFWYAKNSWGEDWGENGYFRIIRNNKQLSRNLYLGFGNF
jgi:C1A family cysteine protease